MVQHLERAIQLLDPAPLAHGEIVSGPVLLCCTTMRTGWTIGVCSALVAESTGRTAMPLVLHRLP